MQIDLIWNRTRRICSRNSCRDVLELNDKVLRGYSLRQHQSFYWHPGCWINDRSEWLDLFPGRPKLNLTLTEKIERTRRQWRIRTTRSRMNKAEGEHKVKLQERLERMEI